MQHFAILFIFFFPRFLNAMCKEGQRDLVGQKGLAGRFIVLKQLAHIWLVHPSSIENWRAYML